MVLIVDILISFGRKEEAPRWPEQNERRPDFESDLLDQRAIHTATARTGARQEGRSTSTSLPCPTYATSHMHGSRSVAPNKQRARRLSRSSYLSRSNPIKNYTYVLGAEHKRKNIRGIETTIGELRLIVSRIARRWGR